MNLLNLKFVKKIRNVAVPLIDLFKLLFFKDIIIFFLDKFNIYKYKTHIYSLKNKLKIFVRTSTADRYEMFGIMSGEEYEIYNSSIQQLKNFPITVVDAGAHIGTFTLYLSTIFKLKKAILIEPDISNSYSVKKNVELNNLKFDYKLIEKALYSNDGFVSFRSDLDTNGRGIDTSNNSLQVPSTSIGTIFQENELEKVDIFKMDIEGGEWFTLNEESKSYFKKVNIFILEYHLSKGNISSLNTDYLKKYFESVGLDLFIFREKTNDMGLMYFKRKNFIL